MFNMLFTNNHQFIHKNCLNHDLSFSNNTHINSGFGSVVNGNNIVFLTNESYVYSSNFQKEDIKIMPNLIQ